MTRQKPSTPPTSTPDQSAAGKGMPAKTLPAQKPLPGRQPSFSDASAESALELPRDRDEAKDMTSRHPDPIIEQAAEDLKDGLKDTSKAPEMDKAYKNL